VGKNIKNVVEHKKTDQYSDEKSKGCEYFMIDLYEEKQIVNEMEIKLKELGNSL